MAQTKKAIFESDEVEKVDGEGNAIISAPAPAPETNGASVEKKKRKRRSGDERVDYLVNLIERAPIEVQMAVFNKISAGRKEALAKKVEEAKAEADRLAKLYEEM